MHEAHPRARAGLGGAAAAHARATHGLLGLRGGGPRWVYVACPGRVMRYRVSFDGELILPRYASSQAPSARSAADKAR